MVHRYEREFKKKKQKKNGSHIQSFGILTLSERNGHYLEILHQKKTVKTDRSNSVVIILTTQRTISLVSANSTTIMAIFKITNKISVWKRTFLLTSVIFNRINFLDRKVNN